MDAHIDLSCAELRTCMISTRLVGSAASWCRDKKASAPSALSGASAIAAKMVVLVSEGFDFPVGVVIRLCASLMPLWFKAKASASSESSTTIYATIPEIAKALHSILIPLWPGHHFFAAWC